MADAQSQSMNLNINNLVIFLVYYSSILITLIMNDPTDVCEMAINIDLLFKVGKGVICPTLERQNKNTIFFPIIYFLFFS